MESRETPQRKQQGTLPSHCTVLYNTVPGHTYALGFVTLTGNVAVLYAATSLL